MIIVVIYIIEYITEKPIWIILSVFFSQVFFFRLRYKNTHILKKKNPHTLICLWLDRRICGLVDFWGSGLGYNLFVMYQRISEILGFIDLILLHFPTPINRSLNPSCQTLDWWLLGAREATFHLLSDWNISSKLSLCCSRCFNNKTFHLA